MEFSARSILVEAGFRLDFRKPENRKIRCTFRRFDLGSNVFQPLMGSIAEPSKVPDTK